MPTIIENTQQVNALNEIEAALAIIKSINAIISAENGTLAIVYKPEKGRKVQVDVPDASRGKAIGILNTTKDRLVKDVKVKAAKFHIGLDEADLACMGDIPQDGSVDTDEAQNSQGEVPNGGHMESSPTGENSATEFGEDLEENETLL